MQTRASRSGFTLLEVMVALAILAIAITTLIGSQNQSIMAAAESDFSFQSSLLARQKMAEIIAAEDEPFNDSGDFGENYPNMFWKLEVNEVDFSDYELLEGTDEYLRRLDLLIHTGNETRTFLISRLVQVEGAP
jgi:general secretion pathway protein I